MRCEDCGTTEGVTDDPCPYAEEMNGDTTPVELCDNCRSERAWDI